MTSSSPMDKNDDLEKSSSLITTPEEKDVLSKKPDDLSIPKLNTETIDIVEADIPPETHITDNLHQEGNTSGEVAQPQPLTEGPPLNPIPSQPTLTEFEEEADARSVLNKAVFPDDVKGKEKSTSKALLGPNTHVASSVPVKSPFSKPPLKLNAHAAASVPLKSPPINRILWPADPRPRQNPTSVSNTQTPSGSASFAQFRGRGYNDAISSRTANAAFPPEPKPASAAVKAINSKIRISALSQWGSSKQGNAESSSSISYQLPPKRFGPSAAVAEAAAVSSSASASSTESESESEPEDPTTPNPPHSSDIAKLRTDIQYLISDFHILQGAFKDLDPRSLVSAPTYGFKNDAHAGAYLTQLDQDLGSLFKLAERREQGLRGRARVTLAIQAKKFENAKEFGEVLGKLDAVRSRLEWKNRGDGGVFVYKPGTRYRVLGDQEEVGKGKGVSRDVGENGGERKTNRERKNEKGKKVVRESAEKVGAGRKRTCENEMGNESTILEADNSTKRATDNRLGKRSEVSNMPRPMQTSLKSTGGYKTDDKATLLENHRRTSNPLAQPRKQFVRTTSMFKNSTTKLPQAIAADTSTKNKAQAKSSTSSAARKRDTGNGKLGSSSNLRNGQTVESSEDNGDDENDADEVSALPSVRKRHRGEDIRPNTPNKKQKIIRSRHGRISTPRQVSMSSSDDVASEEESASFPNLVLSAKATQAPKVSPWIPGPSKIPSTTGQHRRRTSRLPPTDGQDRLDLEKSMLEKQVEMSESNQAKNVTTSVGAVDVVQGGRRNWKDLKRAREDDGAEPATKRARKEKRKSSAELDEEL